MTTAPYGSWQSPITPDLVARASITYSDALEADGGDVYWVESRPNEGGRSVVVRCGADGTITDAVPEGFNARTRVHEYGGGAYAVRGGVVFASLFEDQRIYRIAPGADPVPITPEPKQEAGLRYADPALATEWGIWVRERHTGAGEPINELVRIPLDGSDEPRVIAGGHDFFAAPRLSPDGSRLAFLTWEHPDMPWNSTTLWLTTVDDGQVATPEAVAGGTGESIFQPVWSPDGVLHFSSDRTGWWNPYRLGPQGVESVLDLASDVGVPAWTFRRSRMAFLEDRTLIMVATSSSGTRILRLVPDGGLDEIDPPGTAVAPYLVAAGRDLIVVAASADRFPGVVGVDVDTGVSRPLSLPVDPGVDSALFSIPARITFETPDGPAHAHHYRPHHPQFRAPEEEAPPLIVLGHGGPTSATNTALSLSIQFWTSRGFAVLDVDYGGSTGYGRAYWERLAGTWGVVDVRDCALAARHLVEAGEADEERLAIRGASAGGYSTLAGLAFRDDFAAGASHFGVADLELLARHTHKFESRYLDWLVGPLPEAEAVYRERSPIHHVDQITCPVILFQGLDDRVVPPEQAELMAERLRERNVPVVLLEFEGEGHGFRKAETQIRVLEAELSFYGRVFGFEPA